MCARVCASGNRWGHCEKDAGCTRLTPLPLLHYHSWHQVLASRVQSGYSVLTQQAQHKSISHKKAWPNRKPLNPIFPALLISICVEHKCRGGGGRRWGMKNTGMSVRDVSLFHSMCCEQIHFRCHSFPSHFMHVCVCLWMCVCARVQVTSSPLKWNAVVDPSFQISFPNLELCTVSVASREHAVSLVLLESVENEPVQCLRLVLWAKRTVFFITLTQHRDLWSHWIFPVRLELHQKLASLQWMWSADVNHFSNDY